MEMAAVTRFWPSMPSFPRRLERLEHAYETGEGIEQPVKLERSIRPEGKRICDKYIDPPATMPHAIMFLPTEALYAEVVRRPGSNPEIQSQCRVTIAGLRPSWPSYQFSRWASIPLHPEEGRRGWRSFPRPKTDSRNSAALWTNEKDRLTTVQNTLGGLSSKTGPSTVRSKTSPPGAGAPVSNLIGFENRHRRALLAASAEDD